MSVFKDPMSVVLIAAATFAAGGLVWSVSSAQKSADDDRVAFIAAHIAIIHPEPGVTCYVNTATRERDMSCVVK